MRDATALARAYHGTSATLPGAFVGIDLIGFCLRNRYTHCLSGLEVDHQFKLGRLFDRDVGDLSAAEEFDDLLSHSHE